MNRKKRVLLINEAHWLNSGFSTMGQALLTRLHANRPDLELAELACYGDPNDPKSRQAPWRVYPAIPNEQNQEAMRAYNGDIYAQFGSQMFESVCLDFRPDIVIDIRDAWMTVDWFMSSPYRKYVKYILMPMVDSAPQNPAWLDLYKKVDVLLPACEFAKRTFNNEAPDMKVFPEAVNLSVDEKLFVPLDKKAVRRKLGLPEDINIILKTARNQPRKDWPGILDAFSGVLNTAIEKNQRDIAEKTYLLVHTSYPDVGFDIAKHIQRSGVGHRILVTYVCQACRNFFVGPFETEITFCKHCGQLSAHTPNTGNGLTREQMVYIYNLADLYVQMSCAEGDCMPLSEARACGVPIMGTDYAAIEDKVHEAGGTPLKVARMYWEADSQTGQERALTDIDDVITKVYQFFKLSPERRMQIGQEARKIVEEKYGFDRAIGIFEKAIDSLDLPDHSETWLNPKGNFAPNQQDIPAFRNNVELIDWCIDNIIGRPDLKSSYWRNDLIKSLNVGVYVGRGGREQFSPQTAVNIFKRMADKQNYWENIRVEVVNPKPRPDAAQWELV